ncbi:MAG: 50S ribosomal protein L10 [Sulfolobales archaeon]
MRGRVERLYRRELKNLQKLEKISHEKRFKLEKQKMLAEAEQLLKDSKSIILLDIVGFKSRIFKDMKRRLEEEGAIVRVIKNKILAKALRDLKLKNYEKLEKYLDRPLAVVFSSKHNVFELARIVNSFYSYTKLKAGEKAPFDIVIPAGPTDIPPGPMMSVFGRFRIPVQPREGKIHVIRDTVAVKQGQEVPPELVSLLDKLGIEPVIVRPKILLGYEDGAILASQDLELDLERYITEFRDAWIRSVNLASETLAYVSPVALKLAFLKNFRRAINLAKELKVISVETVNILVIEALSNAYKLAQVIGLIGQKTPEKQEQKIEEKKEEKPKESEEKEVSEETIAEGLSALFG